MKNVLWLGAVCDPSGYGQASRGYLGSLDELPDVRLRVLPKYFWKGPMPELGRFHEVLNRISKTEFQPDEPFTLVQHLTPENWRIVKGKHVFHVGMTTFETDSIPASWQQPMRSVDELWTFSDWSRQVMQREGIKRPIHVVEHGVDTDLFKPGLEPLPELVNLAKEKFLFGSNFDWTERKNPIALLTAYFDAFKGNKDVGLVLKAYFQYPYDQSRQHMLSQIRLVRDMLKLSEDETPAVYLISGIMSDEQIARFYNSINAYVLPSRGEGWGLTYSEAMSCGLPTIAVNWSGHTQFMNEDNSVLIGDFELTTITAEDAGAQTIYVGHKWASVNYEALADAMTRVANNKALRERVGSLARQTMTERFTWKHAAAKVRALLQQPRLSC